MSFVYLSNLVKAFGLKQHTDVDISEIKIIHPEINRLALQLAGFFEYFDSDRLQIIGRVEYAYFAKMDTKMRIKNIRSILENRIPCLIFCRNLEPYPMIVELGNEYKIPIFTTSEITTNFMGEIIKWLQVRLAPQITMHGVFVDIYGEGTLIIGESGIGKSETALELIKRGHRFIADDAVEIKRVSKQTLIGSCPELIRYFIELRGVGVIDVKQMFGVESIKETHNIDLVIKLEFWDNNKTYDRLGLDNDKITILGNEVVCNVIPIRPGRNTVAICESAAINHRQKKMGYNPAIALSERISKNVAKHKIIKEE